MQLGYAPRRFILGPWKSSDEEKRKLRVEVETLRRALDAQRKARARLEEKVKELERELKQKKKEAEGRIKELTRKCRELEKQRDRYRNMVFKPNVNSKGESKKEEHAKDLITVSPKKKRGRPRGHPGQGRKKPQQVDEVRRIYLERCPECGEPIERSNSLESHTVEDIPPPEIYRARVTRYEIEKQWCKKCKKIVKAKILEVISKCRLGINVLLYVLIHKYVARNSWDTIVWSLEHWYGVKVTKGALVDMAHRASKWLEGHYERNLEDIRASPVKHADETGWRINGINHWLWGFFTNRQVYYTTEESRGKGVPEKILAGSHPNDVLVRDDYAGYRKLPLKHQSCWSHLLNDSGEAARQPDASTEACALHKKLKQIYASLSEIVAQPFYLAERQAAYEHFAEEIQKILKTKYRHSDTKKIQARISREQGNLLTALLYDKVPLTNNLAERLFRSIVTARKISGGSKSKEGAKTLAVHMSIIQSIHLQQLPLIPTLKNYLLSLSTSEN